MKVGGEVIAVQDSPAGYYKKFDRFVVHGSKTEHDGTHWIRCEGCSGVLLKAANFKPVHGTQPLPT